MVSVSYLELYMEDLRDLLDSSTPSKDITIREDDQGNTGKYWKILTDIRNYWKIQVNRTVQC